MRRFVVVEGLIGAGKTTLCRLMEREWGARVVLEPSERNPFLEPFYNDPVRFAFPVQMFYLITRWRQQQAIRQQDLFSELVVSDYLFEKDRLFAEKTLPGEELELYDRFTEALGEAAPTPDLLVYLDVPTETVIQRIARRKAPGEEHILPEYLDDLRSRYHRLLEGWTRCPVLVLDNRALNYADDPKAMSQVLHRIRAALEGRAVPGPVASSERQGQPSLFGTET